MAAAPTGEKILILDRGNVEFAYRRDWELKPDPAGHMTLRDPTDSCRAEISYFHVPLPKGALPPLETQLRETLAGLAPKEGRAARIQSGDRGDLWWARADYGYEADDTERGERRRARGRIALAANGRFQVLFTFWWWVDDAAWVEPAFDRIFATLRLGGGEQLKSPRAHWSLRG